MIYKNTNAGFVPVGAAVAGLLALGALGAGALYQYKYSHSYKSQGAMMQQERGAYGAQGMRGQGQGKGHKNMTPEEFKKDHKDTLSKFTVSELDAKEKETLLFVHEEEKMARDIYLNLYEKWGEKVFDKISQSENRHLMATAILLERYGLTDPIADAKRGEFTNAEVIKLYEELISKGEKSLKDALEVGAIIEDMDIKDLQEAIDGTDNEDLKYVYSNLQRASRNHMREFYPKLAAMGVEYKAQYISQEKLEQIVNSPKEKGEKAKGRSHESGAWQRQGRGYGQMRGQSHGYGQGQMRGQGYGRGREMMQGQGCGHEEGG